MKADPGYRTQCEHKAENPVQKMLIATALLSIEQHLSIKFDNAVSVSHKSTLLGHISFFELCSAKPLKRPALDIEGEG